jgi:hypothetical protein
MNSAKNERHTISRFFYCLVSVKEQSGYIRGITRKRMSWCLVAAPSPSGSNNLCKEKGSIVLIFSKEQLPVGTKQGASAFRRGG